MEKHKGHFEKDLFGDKPLQRGEQGYLEPGFYFNDKGEIVDDAGNVYDKGYNLIKEQPSEGLEMARKQHPDWSDDELAPLARIYQKQLKPKRGDPKH